MESSQPTRDDQIIVWIEKDGTPMVLAIFDEMLIPSNITQRDTYRGFVETFGSRAAETAVRLFQVERRNK